MDAAFGGFKGLPQGVLVDLPHPSSIVILPCVTTL